MPVEEAEQLDKIDQLVDILRNFKLPLIPIYTDDLEYATDAFRRINYEGTQMSDVDMIAALSWAQDFDLHERLESFKEDRLNAIGWGQLDEKWILAVCKAHMGLDMYASDPKSVGVQIKDDREFLESAVSDIVKAVTFLADECGVMGPEVLPYGYQLVALSEAFGGLESTHDVEKEELRRWFWFSTYAGVFAGASGTDLSKIFELTRGVAQGQLDPITEVHEPDELLQWETDFFFTRVRSRAVALRLAARQDEHSETSRSNARKALGEYGNNAVHHLFSKKDLSERYYSSPANRYVSEPRRSKEVKQEILQLASESQGDAKAFCVTPDALAALSEDNKEDFVKLREKEIRRVELNFLSSIIGEKS